MDWHTLYSDRVIPMGHSDVTAMLKLAERPEVISFAGGLPDPDTFLLEEIRAIFDRVLAEKGTAALGYGPVHGVTPLREWLAGHMTQDSRPTTMAECLVTTGGIAAVDLISKVLLDPGDHVIVGEPAYLAALHVIRSYQARFIGVPLDEDGMRPDLLEARLNELKGRSIQAKFIYTVPSFQNPAGVTIPEDRRKAIVRMAADHGVPIVEDAAYRDLRFEGKAPPLLAALDPEVIHINTLSKVFNPGVRIGWVTAPRPLIETLALAKQGQDQCSTTIGQYVAHAFASEGLIERQKERAVRIYCRKRDVMLKALEKHFPKSARWTRPEGGFYTWVTLPEAINTEDLLPMAIDKAAVAYGAGPSFYHDRSGQNHMRLSYSYVSESRIEEGIRRLGDLLSKLV
ncbi:MAG: PLP-dependent aminotransferase family protein [Deltaproteobacteria bacterium]|nr:PLP-dependent aminotransferase family protein [Deltaproteobacteria bacterium]